MKQGKKGVVLLITVGFITAIMGVIAYQFTIIDRGLKRSTDETFYYQSALLLADINEKLLPTILKQVNAADLNGSTSKDTNETIGMMISSYYNIPFPLINDEVIGTAVITLKPAGTHFNINDFKNLDPLNEERNFFDYFTQDLYDRPLLADLIDLALENNISRDPMEYEYLRQDDDLVLNSPFFRRGEIVDRDQFAQILDAYYARTKDKTIYKLPWDDFLDFTSVSPRNISYLSEAYCKSLFYDKPLEWHDLVCKNEDETIFTEAELSDLPTDYNATMINHGITFDAFAPKFLIDIDYTVGEKSASFEMLYDLVKTKTLWVRAKL